MKKLSLLIGDRVMKTGIAVFFTALICQWLNWPAVFAVITAIVTIEPTARDSVKKSFIRFPASAIGSAYAVIFISIFGNSPITYTCAAVLTIITCYKLKLHAGLLVATLTAVAMIEVVQSDFFASFFVRLGTTTTGLVVSTLVNIFIFPPKYGTLISNNMISLFKKTGDAVNILMTELLSGHPGNNKAEVIFSELQTDLNKTETLCRFQEADWEFHRFSEADLNLFLKEKEMLNVLRQIHFHLGNLLANRTESFNWDEKQSTTLAFILQQVVNGLRNEESLNDHRYHEQMKELIHLLEDEQFATEIENSDGELFTAKWTVIYEFISIYHLIFNLNKYAPSYIKETKKHVKHG
ncbi:FUSC family protein [Bacillus aquiflavi]|uniref:aromatic acid exporter family protein n=1 Tax=Bacillus aquiflavi TaxID=2672567 RepID=UPI001CAA053F|nr:aromatic acid exporter family protein [Bacillus aquiflavi]UAC48426.1 FUSC family protein [Bacillus aquiflavi]